MDAIVTAGGIPQPDDPLYAYSNGNSKALIDVAGKPMVQWVLDALSDAKSVDNVIVIGLSPRSGVTCKKPMHFVSNQGRMLANIVAGVSKSLELDKKTKYVLVVSSDIPTLKPEMVDWLVETCMQTKDDIYYGVCTREVMEGAIPRFQTDLYQTEGCRTVRGGYQSHPCAHGDRASGPVGVPDRHAQESAQAGGHHRVGDIVPGAHAHDHAGKSGREGLQAHRHQGTRGPLAPCRSLHGCGQTPSA